MRERPRRRVDGLGSAPVIIPVLSPAKRVLALQRSAGNRATCALLQRRPLPQLTGQDVARTSFSQAGASIAGTLTAARELVPVGITGAFDGYATRFNAIARAMSATTIVAIVRDSEGRFHAFDTGRAPYPRHAELGERWQVFPLSGSGWLVVDFVHMRARLDEPGRVVLASRAAERSRRYREVVRLLTLGQSGTVEAQLRRELEEIDRELQRMYSALGEDLLGVSVRNAPVASTLGSQRSSDVGSAPGIRGEHIHIDPTMQERDAAGEAGISHLPVGEADEVPGFGLALGSQVLENGDLASAAGTLAHEGTHYSHAQMETRVMREWLALPAIDRARRIERVRARARPTVLSQDAAERRAFTDWLTTRRGLSAVDRQLLGQIVYQDTSGSELLAYAEGFATSFPLRDSAAIASGPPREAAFRDLGTMIEHWSAGRSAIADAAVARIASVYRAVSQQLRAEFDRWVDAASARSTGAREQDFLGRLRALRGAP